MSAGQRWDQVAGRPVRTLVLGRPQELPDLVVVPGLGALGYLLPALRACAAWTRVHLLDLPGFGRLSTAGQPADLADVARTTAAWLEQVPTRPVLLLGHSTGGQAVLRAALERPGPVARLVLAGTTFPPGARSLRAAAGLAARTLPHEQPGEVPAVLPYYLRGARRLPELLRSALRDRPEDGVPRLQVPLLVLRGRHDRLCPQAWAQQLADLAPDGRLVVLPGGHNTPWTHPAQTAAAVREHAAS